TTVGDFWEDVYVARVAKVEKHPNADRLVLATAELPDESITVVCGAPNVAEGQKVPFAKVGARLIDAHTGELTVLKAAKIRGVVSAGMICSERELGVSDEHTVIMVLPPDAPLGVPLAEYIGDSILELDVTPNRPDCLSMLGVAWEVAALAGSRASPPQVKYEQGDPPAEELAAVEIADPDLCSRYCASVVTGVRVASSPQWMQDRLLAAGMRPINNIVDITNYVMLEYGQPLHAFDYHKIRDQRIIVRRAARGERFVTLDGEDRDLDEEMLLIADPAGAIGLAGVMGGANTEVSEDTTAILLESANFNNVNIRRTSTRLRLRSEASLRFDKGLSPELPLPALLRATQLLAELTGGIVARGVIDIYPGRVEREPLRLTSRRVQQVLGLKVKRDRMVGVLESLGFICREEDRSVLLVTVPYWRTDVSIEDDLVEEVARIMGYDQLPITSLRGQIPSREPDRDRRLTESVRDILASCGMQEVINYSLTGLSAMEKAHTADLASARPLRVSNPMRPEQEYLRLSLRPGLLANVAQNERHQEEGLRLFEIGKVYLPGEGELPAEQERLAGVVTEGEAASEEGFLLAKGILETLLERLGVEARFETSDDSGLHPGRVVGLRAEGDELGVLGEVHPQVAGAFDIESASVYLFDIELETLFRHISPSKRYRPIPRFPGVVRDLAVLVDAQTSARVVEEIIKAFPLVSSAKLFDIYSGDQVMAGKKSLAYRILYQSPSRTLTEEEVSIVQAQLVQKLAQEAGAQLRGPG
ncbi:MAG: phenylalanine--tRNA ligase subunit beta, partial [Dehalococcoidia bacterium]